MKAHETLPEGYRELCSIDLQKNKKTMLLVNAAAIIIAVAMVVPACFYVPISALFDMENGFAGYIIRFASIAVLSVLYIVLHELVHGIAMKLCGTKKVKYGFTGMYAFAGSEDYYDKKAYVFIALNPFVPAEWFWVVYLIQISNISGAAGDFFVTLKFSRFPKDILVRDYGVGMTVYSAT